VVEQPQAGEVAVPRLGEIDEVATVVDVLVGVRLGEPRHQRHRELEIVSLVYLLVGHPYPPEPHRPLRRDGAAFRAARAFAPLEARARAGLGSGFTWTMTSVSTGALAQKGPPPRGAGR